MLLAGLHAEGIDPIAVGHPHLHQILLMAPEHAYWQEPITCEMVRAACMARRVRNFEPVLEAMTQWLNSPQAAWLFLYLHEIIHGDPPLGPSAWIADSVCRVYAMRSSNSQPMLKAIADGLRVH